jgi:hypothetical protein
MFFIQPDTKYILTACRALDIIINPAYHVMPYTDHPLLAEDQPHVRYLEYWSQNVMSLYAPHTPPPDYLVVNNAYERAMTNIVYIEIVVCTVVIFILSLYFDWPFPILIYDLREIIP